MQGCNDLPLIRIRAAGSMPDAEGYIKGVLGNKFQAEFKNEDERFHVLFSGHFSSSILPFKCLQRHASLHRSDASHILHPRARARSERITSGSKSLAGTGSRASSTCPSFLPCTVIGQRDMDTQGCHTANCVELGAAGPARQVTTSRIAAC